MVFQVMYFLVKLPRLVESMVWLYQRKHDMPIYVYLCRDEEAKQDHFIAYLSLAFIIQYTYHLWAYGSAFYNSFKRHVQQIKMNCHEINH